MFYSLPQQYNKIQCFKQRPFVKPQPIPQNMESYCVIYVTSRTFDVVTATYVDDVTKFISCVHI